MMGTGLWQHGMDGQGRGSRKEGWHRYGRTGINGRVKGQEHNMWRSKNLFYGFYSI